jgi:hypothetical protein
MCGLVVGFDATARLILQLLNVSLDPYYEIEFEPPAGHQRTLPVEKVGETTDTLLATADQGGYLSRIGKTASVV